MVKGLNKFKKHFVDYKDRYVLIGGTASTLAMNELGVDFRATKDIDIVLCVEVIDPKFTKVFWDFVKMGQYQTRQKSTGKHLFYRFHDPKNREYPEMLELFSRLPNEIIINEEAQITPIPVDEEISSLSAILLDDDYYKFIHDHKRVIEDLSTIGAEVLIPLKAHAYMDLSNRKAEGEKVRSISIKKHKNDIFRLYTVLNRETPCPLPESIQRDLCECFDRLLESPFDLKPFGIRNGTVPIVIEELTEFYKLNQSTPD